MPASQPPAHATFRDYVQLHLVVLAWGFTAILGKLITMPALETAIWRTGLAALGLLIIAQVRGLSLRAPRGITLAMLGTGLLIGWHWMLFFLSARTATASVCLAAMPTIMLWSSLTEPLINRSYRWSVGELLMGLVMVGAVWLIYHFEFKHWWGFTIGIASAMLGGVFAVINKQLTPYQPPITICFYQMIGACAGCAMLLPVMGSGKIAQVSLSDLLWLLALSQVCTVGAYIAYLDLLRCMSVFTINVVYNLEPVYGIILAALIFGERERMSGGFYLGASVIILAVLLMPFINRHRNPAAETPQVN